MIFRPTLLVWTASSYNSYNQLATKYSVASYTMSIPQRGVKRKIAEDETESQGTAGNLEPMGEQQSNLNSVETQPEENGRKLAVLMRTSQCLQFKSLLECLKELLTEVNVEFIENKGVRLVAIDPGNVAMVHLEINAVEYFYAKGTVMAGIDMSFLHRMIRSMSSNDLMSWKIFDDEPHVMCIELENSDRRTTTVSKLKLLDLEEVNISIPPTDYERVVRMPSSDLAKFIREMSNVGNILTVRGTRDTLEFLAEGKMASSHIIVKPTSAGLNWRHETNSATIEGNFLVKYVEKFSKISVDASVELFLKQNFPLVFRYELSIGTLRFVIAPVVDSD